MVSKKEKMDQIQDGESDLCNLAQNALLLFKLLVCSNFRREKNSFSAA